ncbi:MAG: DUF4405 domain-containing protein [Kiritimatiellae bacterium]|nr:DUF4405 domain-containing protein [Kiritimatiellia bacterium]
MKTRRLISLTALFSFVLLLLTGVVLYIVPHGRIAYWSDWHWLGLSKTQWGDLHISSGVLFVIVGIWHICLNWDAILRYLQGRRTGWRAPSVELVTALLLTGVLCVGTYMEWPPFSWTVALSEHIKDMGAEKHGEPPYGHAERSSLEVLARRMRLDPSAVLQSLEKAGIVFQDETSTLGAIARENGTTPNAIYTIILAEQSTRSEMKSPQGGRSGRGEGKGRNR